MNLSKMNILWLFMFVCLHLDKQPTMTKCAFQYDVHQAQPKLKFNFDKDVQEKLGQQDHLVQWVPPGPQGVRGEPGVCECDENEIERLRNSVQELKGIPRNLHLF